MSEYGSDTTEILDVYLETENTIADFMNEIQSESAARLLNVILHEVSPFGSSGITALDEQLLSSSAELPPSTSPLNRGDVIEIQGPPASGKTLLSYHLVMSCILPRELPLAIDSGHQSYSTTNPRIEVGGWERGAVIFDCDGRWNVTMLTQLLFARFLDVQERIKGGQLISSVEELVEDCLKRVHIFKPQSTLSMTCTILQLPRYHEQHMANVEIALMVIDSISAFYWQDRFSVEQQRNTDNLKTDTAYPMDRFLIALQDFRLTYGTATFMSNWGLSSLLTQNTLLTSQQLPDSTAASGNRQDELSPFYRQHLHPFPSPFEFPARVLVNAQLYPPITHHITLSLPPLALVPPETQSLLEAEDLQKQQYQSNEVVGIIRFVSSGRTANFTTNIGPNGTIS